MVDFRAELAALVAAYDEHGGQWSESDVDELWHAAERARDVLAQPEPAPAADGEVGDLVLAMKELAYDRLRVSPDTSDLLHRAADLLERQAAAAPVARLPEDAQVIEPANRTILVPVPAPIPVSERLPGPEDCLPWPSKPDETHWCWAFSKGPLDDDWWEQRSVTSLTNYRSAHTHWLPAHALPLPEVK